MSFDDLKWAQTSMEMLARLDEGCTQLPREGREHYLGMSSIGGCAAELWHNYHNATQHGAGIEPKLQRVFDLGHKLESMVLQYLLAADNIDMLSTQAAYEDFGGRFRGHSDIVYRASSGKKVVYFNNFNNFNRLGVKESHWKYYCQVMTYAKYEGADAVQIIAYNKDTSAIAIQTLGYDEFTGDMMRSRAEWILRLDKKPPCEKGNGRVKWCGCGR